MSGESEEHAFKAIEALRAAITQLRFDLPERFDQLEATMKQNREALMRQVQRYGR